MKIKRNKRIKIYLVLTSYLLVSCHLKNNTEKTISNKSDTEENITLKVKWIDSAAIDKQNNKAIIVSAYASNVNYPKMKSFADSLIDNYSNWSYVIFFNNYDSIPKPLGPGGAIPKEYNLKKFKICEYMLDFEDSTYKFFNHDGDVLYDPSR